MIIVDFLICPCASIQFALKNKIKIKKYKNERIKSDENKNIVIEKKNYKTEIFIKTVIKLKRVYEEEEKWIIIFDSLLILDRI